MCHRALTVAERAVLLDGDDPEVAWCWVERQAPPDNDNDDPEPEVA